MLDFAEGRLVGNAPVAVPQARRLARLRLTRADLEAGLAAFVAPESELTPWVEAVVEDARGGSDLYRIVREATEGKPYRVLRVLAMGNSGENGLALEDDGEDAGALLGDPKAVFQRLLAMEPMEEPDRERLATAFDELRSLLEDRRREAGVAS